VDVRGEKFQHSTYCTIFIDQFYQFNMWRIGRIHFFTSILVPHAEACTLTDIYGQYADACFPYRHCSPVCEFAFRCAVGAARILAPRRAMLSPASPLPTDQLPPCLLYRVGCQQQLLLPSSGLYKR